MQLSLVLRGRAFNAAVATVVTLLVWSWAYDATRTRGDATGKVIVRAPEGAQIHVEPAAATSVVVRFTGTQGSVRAAQQAIGAGIELTAGSGGVPAVPGEHTLEIARLIAQSPQIERLGISIDSASPPQLRIRVSELATVTARVETDLSDAQVAGDIAVEPQDVSVTIPKEALAAMPELRPVAMVEVSALERGRRHSVDADVSLPRVPARWADAVRISPARVRVAFALRSNVRTATLASVPVQVAAPPAQLARFDIAPAAGFDALRQVSVSGPAEAIAALEDGSARVAAVISLGGEDFAPGTVSRRIGAWIAPPGVTVLRVGDVPASAAEVSVRISPR